MSKREEIISGLYSKNYTLKGMDKKRISSFFGENTFNDKLMKERFSSNIYKRIKKCIMGEEKLDIALADQIAHAMKEWAIEKGATHYCHWFQPLTGTTAEKHDAFIEKIDGKIIEGLTGKQLVRQEPDASSFPSGGLRATFEARGYTAWDPTSPAFILSGDSGSTLCIPSIFISHYGHSLDKKTPLLRSCKFLEEKVKNLLKLFNMNVNKVSSNIGVEQEFFLIDRELAMLRPDLLICGRTLFGARPPKGQELDDQYFGSIKERIMKFFNEVEYELYKLGVPVKTRHNEVAPHQYEFAPIFEEANIAADHNQLMMEVLKRTAIRHGLFLSLHEKPFDRINGSGKHINWSISADNTNLLEPGDNPSENIVFLIILTAIIKGIMEYSPLLRASIACASNDHRLGGNEAPPAIISIYLGENLTYTLNMMERGNIQKNSVDNKINLGFSAISSIPRDNTDRNRTSPFAFTGNKFEFRAVGSSQSIAIPVTMINTIVADTIDSFRIRIDKKMSEGFKLFEAVTSVVKEEIPLIRPILFEGDNYSQEWSIEAQKRKLPNLPDTPSALEAAKSPELLKILIKNRIFSSEELKSRYLVELEKYCKTIHIESQLCLEIARTKLLPAALKQQKSIAENIKLLKEIDEPESVSTKEIRRVLETISECINQMIPAIDNLEIKANEANEKEDLAKSAWLYCHEVLPLMNNLRELSDLLETLIDDNIWPLPKYYELLFFD